MSLINCRECKKEYSDKALKCPNCGCPTELNANNEIVCKECQSEYNCSSKKCPNCGCPTEFNISDSTKKENIESVINCIVYEEEPVNSKEEWDEFIVENIEYYNDHFRKLKITNNYISWNWSAFLIHVLWFVYRRMYQIGLGVAVGTLILVYFFPILILFIPVGSGLFGNYIYLKHIESNVKQAKSMDERDKGLLLKSTAGVSSKHATLVAIVYVVLIFISGFLFG